MGRSTRRAVLQGTAALAGLAAVQASGLAGSAQAGTAVTTLWEAAMSTGEDPTSGAGGTAELEVPGLEGGELREGYAELGDQRLHYVEAGQGPLVVLLHGFPEFWYGWRLQLHPLAADIRGLVQERGAHSALLVGHDWGGTVAWATAMHHPEVVDRLAILNAAHPRKLSQGLHHPGQLRKSWYFFFFALPSCPKAWSMPTTGISSGTFWTTPTRPTAPRSSTAMSRRGPSRGQPPR